MKEVINTEKELDSIRDEYNKKNNQTHRNPWVWQATLSDFEEMPIMEDSGPKGEPVEERIEIAVSKSGHDMLYVSCYFAKPLDSWGANWDITDSGCFTLKEKEIDILIAKLQEAKKVMIANKK